MQVLPVLSRRKSCPTLEENPETDFKDKGKQSRSLPHLLGELNLVSSRDGNCDHEPNLWDGRAGCAIRAQPSAADRCDLYPEFLKTSLSGVVLLHLENPQDVKTYRIIDLNPAAAEITGSTPEALLAGHSLISLNF